MEQMDILAVCREKDNFSKMLGVEIVELKPGFARGRMPLTPQHYNCFGIVHAGAIFTLADTTFGAAVNFHQGRLSPTVSMNCQFLKAGRGQVLTAVATESSPGPKLASYNVEVRDESGDVVAVFQCMAYRKKATLEELFATKAREANQA